MAIRERAALVSQRSSSAGQLVMGRLLRLPLPLRLQHVRKRLSKPIEPVGDWDNATGRGPASPTIRLQTMVTRTLAQLDLTLGLWEGRRLDYNLD